MSGYMNNLKPVVIVIPRYSINLSMCEEVALRQVHYILGHYDIVYVSPEKMREFYSPTDNVEYFDDNCFSSVYAYSELLMTTEFYMRFLQYEYMLIYQLDAFVFRDDLLQYCKMGYDYIGAPISRFHSMMKGRVGNGGLSLRKVSSCLRMTRDKNSVIKSVFKNIPDDKKTVRPEDQFFGWCGYNDGYDFLLPDVKIALSFSVENNVQHVYKKIEKGELPFGVHGWSRSFNFFLWKDFIAESKGCEGVDISLLEHEILKKESITYKEIMSRAVMAYFYKRLARKDKCSITLSDTFPLSDSYVIWGNGVIGKRILNLFFKCGYYVTGVVDKKFEKNSISEHVECSFFSVDNIKTLVKKNKVIVAVKQSDEIYDMLQQLHLEYGKDFFDYKAAEKIFLSRYLAFFGS